MAKLVPTKVTTENSRGSTRTASQNNGKTLTERTVGKSTVTDTRDGHVVKRSSEKAAAVDTRTQTEQGHTLTSTKKVFGHTLNQTNKTAAHEVETRQYEHIGVEFSFTVRFQNKEATEVAEEGSVASNTLSCP